MKKLIVLNHKMNLDYDEVFPYIDKLNKIETDNDIVVCPSNIYLTDFINHCSWGVGSQNVFYEANGNYTGEVSTTQLKSLGVEYSLIGHYERKKYFKEDNKTINKKLKACLDSNIIPILCFGGTGNQEEVLDELREILKDIERIDFIIFAYEPLEVDEDIDLEEIRENLIDIYNYLLDLYETRPTIIYGGGVVDKDINELLKIDNLDGLLIGAISSDIEKTEEIIKLVD